MPDISRISTLSTWLYWTALVLMIVLPVALIAILMRYWLNPDDLIAQFPGVTASIRPSTALIVTLIGALSLPSLLVALDQARQLFARYRSGEILSQACASHIHRVGQMLVTLAFLGVILPTLQVLLLSWGNPPGQKILQIGFADENLGFLLAGGMLTVIGWVMREAARVKAENEAFV
jgi:hypothetical protein